MDEKQLYVVRDCDYEYLYVVKAESIENAMELVNQHLDTDRDDWVVEFTDNENGEILEDDGMEISY